MKSVVREAESKTQQEKNLSAKSARLPKQSGGQAEKRIGITNKKKKNILRDLCVLCGLGFSTALFALAGCGTQEKKEEHIEYPERKHGEGEPMLVLTKHQLEHIEFAVEAAEEKAVTIPLALPGRVALNDRATAHITARVVGRIEKVHRVINDRVQQGEVILELYSQEFLTMQSEFVRSEERFKGMTPEQTDYGTAKSIYESSKKKLQIVGFADKEISDLADSHIPVTYLPVRAPFGGTLIEGGIRQGEVVQVGTDFYTIANLSKLWVIADVFEHDLPLVREGIPGEIVVAPYPTETFPGRLTTVYDMVDAKSRTIKTRFHVENRQGKLKPEMFATVHIRALFGGRSLKVPSLAVMENKNEKYVFVAVNDTTFEQRPVKIGFETQVYTEVLSGLKPGERVVTKGTFYLKSERAKETFVEEE